MIVDVLILIVATVATSCLVWLWTVRHCKSQAQRRLALWAESLGLDAPHSRSVVHAETLRLAEMTSDLKRRVRTARSTQFDLHVMEAAAARNHRILEVLPDGVLAFEAGERLVYANERGRELLGCPRDATPCLAELPAQPDLVQAIRDVLGADLARGARSRKLTLNDGMGNERQIWKVRELGYLSSISPDQRQALVLLEDVTFEEASARMKSEFVYGVSHELKTPLTGIQAALEMLVEDLSPDDRDGAIDSADRERLLRLAHGESVRLARMIQELLDLARVEAGIMQRSQVRIEVGNWMEELLAAQRTIAERKSVHLVANTSAYVPALRGDPDLLRQALVNLIGNAIKYTPAGGIVEVRSALEGDELFISVRDTGIGIGAEDLPRIFDKFFRASSAKRAALPGTGLGLPLARYIIESHEGRVEVDSELGRGTEFRVYLPMSGSEGDEEALQFESIAGFSGACA